MPSGQPSTSTLANTAAVTGGAGLAAMILFFTSMFLGLLDGSFSYLLLLGGGIVLGIVGTISGILALVRQSVPKYKAVIGLVTGLIAIAILVLIILFGLALSASFSNYSF